MWGGAGIQAFRLADLSLFRFQRYSAGESYRPMELSQLGRVLSWGDSAVQYVRANRVHAPVDSGVNRHGQLASNSVFEHILDFQFAERVFLGKPRERALICTEAMSHLSSASNRGGESAMRDRTRTDDCR